MVYQHWFYVLVRCFVRNNKKQPKMSTENDRQQVQRTLGLACTHGNQNNVALSKSWTWLVGEVQVQCRNLYAHRQPAGICCTNTESNWRVDDYAFFSAPCGTIWTEMRNINISIRVSIFPCFEGVFFLNDWCSQFIACFYLTLKEASRDDLVPFHSQFEL